MTSDERSGLTPKSFDELHREAVVRVQEAFQSALELSRLPLEKINRIAGPDRPYCHMGEFLREQLACAAEAANFAVALGLVTAEECGHIWATFYRENEGIGDIGWPAANAPAENVGEDA